MHSPRGHELTLSGRLAFAVAATVLTLMATLAPARAQTVEPTTDPTVDTPASGLTAEGVSLDAVDDGDRTIQIVEVDQSAYPQVDVVVAVPPAFDGELFANSFGLTEDGSVKATQVEKLRDLLEVVVVIDTSGSMTGAPIESAKAAALNFVDTLAADVRISVVGFGERAVVQAPLGSDRATVRAAISGLAAGGETSLYDALVLASQQYTGDDARRFTVVLSDGNDTVSTATLGDATAALVGADLKLYTITLTSPEVQLEALTTLTNDVGGELVEATDTAQLAQVFGAVASRLKNLYRVRYQSRAIGPVPLVISVDVAGDLAIASQVVAIQSDQAPEPPPTTGSSEPSVPVRPQGGALVTTVAAPTGFLQSSTALYLGAGILFALVAALSFLLLSREPSGPTAMQRLNFSASMPRRSGLASVADRASGFAERMLDKGEKRNALDEALEKGGLDMRPGEFIAASVAAAVGLGALFFVLKGPLFGLGAVALGLVGSRVVLKRKASKRQKLFGQQLGDTLMMIAGAMRAGHGVMEAIDTVASQADSPTCEEFSRAITESRIGRDMVDSLYDIATRTGSEDFVWVVRAISINRELGGDLAEILDNVGETIRDRNRLRDQVRALSAEGKVSAMILFSLPLLVAAWVRMSNPEYMTSMTQETGGKVMLGLALFEMILGGLWLKKLVKVDF